MSVLSVATGVVTALVLLGFGLAAAVGLAFAFDAVHALLHRRRHR